MGQALRQLVFYGADTTRVYGSDLQQNFIDLGYELFKDRETLSSQFVAGDMLNPADEGLRQLDGKMTMVHAQSFFHLFDRNQQLAVAQRIVGFIKPGTKNAMVYGRHIGSIKPGEMRTSRRTWFLHDQGSFQKLWDEVGDRTGTRWRVEVTDVGKLPIQIPGLGNDARSTRYAVYQTA
jgi:hypothetical protein